MSNIPAPAVGTRLAVALLVLVTSACSDHAATAPEIAALAPLAAKNGPNAAPTTGRIFCAREATGTMSCTRSIPMARTFVV